jgi:hypothetical protein
MWPLPELRATDFLGGAWEAAHDLTHPATSVEQTNGRTTGAKAMMTKDDLRKLSDEQLRAVSEDEF